VEHVGIDLGARKSQVCRRLGPNRYSEFAVPTHELPALMGTWPPSRVVMESCAESHAIAEAARAAGHDVVVVPSSLVRELGVGKRNMKTDQRDARVLCDSSVRLEDELPRVHLKSERSRRWLELVSTRSLLVQSRTSFVSAIKGHLRCLLHASSTRFGPKFTAQVRELLTNHPSGLGTPMASLLDAVDALTEQIERLQEEVTLIAKGMSSDEGEPNEQAAAQSTLVRRAMTMPGVGALTALALLGTIDDPTRFTSTSKLSNYLGLSPGQDTTGFQPKLLGITKAGPSMVRWLLIQCAWSMIRSRPHDPIVRWSQQIAQRRNPRIAAVALARKIACVQWAMWREERDYDPSLVCRSRDEQSVDTATDDAPSRTSSKSAPSRTSSKSAPSKSAPSKSAPSKSASSRTSSKSVASGKRSGARTETSATN
jgi:transposase